MIEEGLIGVLLYDGDSPPHSECEGSGLQTQSGLVAFVFVQVDQPHHPADGFFLEAGDSRLEIDCPRST